MPFRRVLFLNSGYCTQSAYLAGRSSRGRTRFPAVFVYLEHPDHEPALIDTGYGPAFLEATRPFPQRLYRWMTPLHLDPQQHAAAILEARGLRPESIGNIFVSHLHGDHVAGLRYFPTARFVYRPAALSALMCRSVWSQLRQAFLAGLLPKDFTTRSDGLHEATFLPGEGLLQEFRVHDYWGDGDLLLVDLPGHAVGHTGFLIRTETQRFLYIVDACWDLDALLQARPLPWLSQKVQVDYPAYVQTQEKLRRVAQREECLLLACHCLRTQAYVS